MTAPIELLPCPDCGSPHLSPECGWNRRLPCRKCSLPRGAKKEVVDGVCINCRFGFPRVGSVPVMPRDKSGDVA